MLPRHSTRFGRCRQACAPAIETMHLTPPLPHGPRIVRPPSPTACRPIGPSPMTIASRGTGGRCPRCLSTKATRRRQESIGWRAKSRRFATSNQRSGEPLSGLRPLRRAAAHDVHPTRCNSVQSEFTGPVHPATVLQSPRQMTLPSTVLNSSLPPAAAKPSQVGASSKLYSPSLLPSVADTAHKRPPRRPA